MLARAHGVTCLGLSPGRGASRHCILVTLRHRPCPTPRADELPCDRWGRPQRRSQKHREEMGSCGLSPQLAALEKFLKVPRSGISFPSGKKKSVACCLYGKMSFSSFGSRSQGPDPAVEKGVTSGKGQRWGTRGLAAGISRHPPAPSAAASPFPVTQGSHGTAHGSPLAHSTRTPQSSPQMRARTRRRTARDRPGLLPAPTTAPGAEQGLAQALPPSCSVIL